MIKIHSSKRSEFSTMAIVEELMTKSECAFLIKIK